MTRLRHPASFFALLSLSIAQANAQRYRSSLVDTINSLGLSGVDTFIFFFIIILGVVTLCQAMGAIPLLLFPRTKRPHEEFRKRVPYAIWIILATSSLTASYAMTSVSWYNDRAERYRGPPWDLNGPFAAFADLLPRVADIALYVGILCLFGDRYDAFVEQAEAAGDTTRPGKRVFYRATPYILLAAMAAATVVRFGILASNPNYLSLNSYFQVVDALNAMGHVYVAFNSLLVINIAVTFVTVWHRTRSSPSESWVAYDRTVFGRLTKHVVPVIVVKAIYDIISHIIIYSPTILVQIDHRGFIIATLFITGSMYAWIFTATLRMGFLPRGVLPSQLQPSEKVASA